MCVGPNVSAVLLYQLRLIPDVEGLAVDRVAEEPVPIEDRHVLFGELVVVVPPADDAPALGEIRPHVVAPRPLGPVPSNWNRPNTT